ncbi:hypothetical protein ACIQC5_08210 [Paenarthrobacter sp. NPDC092416]|uniref:hypothetical protein n=1 Tax=Paenarthrobacter sp. NPDC092416 TaxID=3364386 RepID=UPI00380AF325
MTSRDCERETIVDELLLDADLADATDVRHALLSLGSFATLPAPAPGAELAAMLTGPHDELTKRRWQRKHRTAVVGFAVVAAMGLGVSGVAAASSGFTRNPDFIDQLLGNWAPQWKTAPSVLPSPDAPKVSTEPAPAVDPAAVPQDAQLSVSAEAAVPAQPDMPAEPATPAQPGMPAQPGAPAQEAAAKPSPNTADQVTPSKPVDVKPEHATKVKPTPSPTVPAAAKPGTEHKKPPRTLPSLTDKKTDKESQALLDKLKQWLKH